MITRLKIACVAFVLSAALAPTSSADGLHLGITKKHKHGAFSFGFSTGPYWGRMCAERWVPAHYETVCRPVWVEGCERRVWVPPTYGWVRDPCGRLVWACVRAGHFERIREPGRYENREVRVWVEGTWSS